MNENPVYKRNYAAFISHAHTDKDIVDRIFHWLTSIADIPIWYDSQNLDASDMIATQLPKAIKDCRSMIIVLSESSIRSGWVEKEYNAAEVEKAQYPQFRIIPIRIDNCDIPGFLEATVWIDAREGKLNIINARQLLLSLYPGPSNIEQDSTRDIYCSIGWRPSEIALNAIICGGFIKKGFRLIGDSPDQNAFDKISRIMQLIKSCGGFLAILPDRGNGNTSKYIIEEIEHAKKLNMHGAIFAVKSVDIAKNVEIAKANGNVSNDFYLDVNSIIPIPPAMDETILRDSAFTNALYEMEDEWKMPEKPQYIFIAHDFDAERKEIYGIVREVIQRVTSMQCISGDQIRQSNVQASIRQKISSAFAVIADISNDNVNSCIEAGIAQGANIGLHLISRYPRKRPPFMFRDQQVWHYNDDIELLGLVHKIIRPYRRRVINNELIENKKWV